LPTTLNRKSGYATLPGIIIPFGYTVVLQHSNHYCGPVQLINPTETQKLCMAQNMVFLRRFPPNHCHCEGAVGNCGNLSTHNPQLINCRARHLSTHIANYNKYIPNVHKIANPTNPNRRLHPALPFVLAMLAVPN